jgi:hypothetical protein
MAEKRALHVVALSGGKDSTAMSLRMHELGMGVDHYLTTPTGDELPEVGEHIERMQERLGGDFVRLTNHTLDSLIDHFSMLPNHRARWCTRLIKIQPCLDRIRTRELPVTLYVGLRADEEERRGIFADDVDTRFPMREWGWTLDDVIQYLKKQDAGIPRRTDCARCFHQRLSEWWAPWQQNREIYNHAAAQEERISALRGKPCTLRSPGRDTWPVSLRELGEMFSARHVPRGTIQQLDLFGDENNERQGACRVCTM